MTTSDAEHTPGSQALPAVIVAGASAGGVQALRRLVAGLPEDFAAPLIVVLHMQAGAKCENCHPISETGDKMRVPALSGCLQCHRAVLTESPAIQKLAALSKEPQPPSWAQVYRLPDFVFFSHRKHLNAGAECAVCHGPVQDRDTLWQEKEVSMVACVGCHKLRKASINCDLCHNIGR